MPRKTVVRVVVYDGEETQVDEVLARSLPEINRQKPPFTYGTPGSSCSIHIGQLEHGFVTRRDVLDYLNFALNLNLK